MDKKNKELLNHIVDTLKSKEDLTYREGAWENFNKTYGSSNHTTVKTIAKWSAAAAILACIGVASVLYNTENSNNNIDLISQQIHSNDPAKPLEIEIQNNSITEPTVASSSATANAINDINSQNSINNSYVFTNSNNSDRQLNILEGIKNISIDNPLKVNLSNIEVNKDNLSNQFLAQLKSSNLPSTRNMGTQHILANQVVPLSSLKAKEVEAIAQNKQFRLNDKFDLGLYVSPYSTSEKMNVGGGLLIAYNLTDKISLRTGASYNSYEVGMLKNPTDVNSAEMIKVEDQNMSYAANSIGANKNASDFQNKMILPNIDAVTGTVQSLDIPLEVKYKLGKNLYTAAGVSYSAILNQNRRAHYMETVENVTFMNAAPHYGKNSNQEVKMVAKTAVSAEDNVNTQKFNGFVNFSIGKKVPLNSKMGISVEPFVKIPLGNYRQTDMDYTNGGIRIMTNF